MKRTFILYMYVCMYVRESVHLVVCMSVCVSVCVCVSARPLVWPIIIVVFDPHSEFTYA